MTQHHLSSFSLTFLSLLSVLKSEVVWTCPISWMGCELPLFRLAECSVFFLRTHGLDFPFFPLLIFHKNNKPRTDVNGSMHGLYICVHIWAVWFLRRLYWHKFGIFTSGKFIGEIMQPRLNEFWRAFITPSDKPAFLFTAKGFIWVCVHAYI